MTFVRQIVPFASYKGTVDKVKSLQSKLNQRSRQVMYIYSLKSILVL